MKPELWVPEGEGIMGTKRLFQPGGTDDCGRVDHLGREFGEQKMKRPVSSLTLGLGADEAGRGVVEGLEDSGDRQADILVTGVQADRCKTKVLEARRLLGTHLDVGDLDREGAFASILLPPPHPHRPRTRTPPHLLLPTDMAHGGSRCRAGGRPQDRHDPLRQDLTHCEG